MKETFRPGASSVVGKSFFLQLRKPLGERTLFFVLWSSSLSHDHHSLTLLVSYKHIMSSPIITFSDEHIAVYHGDFALALTRCSCSALREVAVFVRECGKCKPLYASVIERCVTLPVGTWSAACEQSFRFDGGHVHNVTTLHFERKETKTKFVSNKTAIYHRNRSSVCLLFVKLALLCVFFFVYPTHDIHKSKPGACLGCKR